MNRGSMNSLELEEKAPQGWFSRFDIEVLVPEIKLLKKGDTYLEIGVYLGRSLWVAQQTAVPGVWIMGVDILEDPKIPHTLFMQIEEGEVADIPRIVDLLFIDANHSYEGCKADIENYAPHVREGGVMLFHDCDETSPGVVQAVNEYADEHGLTVELFKREGFNTSMAKIQL